MRGRALLTLGVAPVLLLVLVGRFVDESVVHKEQLYRILESLGALLSLGTGMFLLRRVRPSTHCPRFWMSCSLLVMAALGGFHAVLPVGARFHAIQALSLGAGALLVVPVIFGRSHLTPRMRTTLPLALGATGLVIGLVTLLSYRWWPVVAVDASGLFWPTTICGVSGVLFLAAAYRFRYHALNEQGGPERALSAICLLLGLGGLTLQLAPDGAVSWLWQLTRSTAYLLLLISMERMSRDEHRVLVDTMACLLYTSPSPRDPE